MLDINFNQIIEMIEKRKNDAYRKVNEEMILLYLEVGKFLYELKETSGYGDKITTKAADFMKNNYPAIKGFTKRNIERMIQFYSTYKDDEIATPLVTQLSWTNNLLILSGSKTEEERHFYLQLSIKNNYSKRELDRQITSSYYERYMLSDGKQLPTTNKTIDEDDYPNTRILDTYSLEFLDLPNEYTEKDLKNAILTNLKDFILEVGKDFTFIGDEYRVQVGNHDFFIDLLFYNRELSCLVAFELKLGEFKAEYLGKMNLYLEALDRDVKKAQENPSVGIILCSSKDKDVVEYSLSKNMSQTLISEYKLKLIDKKLLETKLKEMKALIENDSEEKMMTDEQYIDIAIEISKNAKYPYGAIVVKDGKIIGRSDDKTLMETSIYSHAELEAIESASKNKNLYGDLKGATMYVSCEPCMMCMGAILYEEFDKLVYAATLQDSNDNYCPEMITNIDELAKYSKNKIEIVKELHRDIAVNIIKERGASNEQ